jgi:hypothetical protein
MKVGSRAAAPRAVGIAVGAKFTRPVVVARCAIVPVVARLLALLIGSVVARSAIGLTIVRAIGAPLIRSIALRLPIVLVRGAILIGLALSRGRLNRRGEARLAWEGRGGPLDGRSEAIGQTSHVVFVVHIVFALS